MAEARIKQREALLGVAMTPRADPATYGRGDRASRVAWRLAAVAGVAIVALGAAASTGRLHGVGERWRRAASASARPELADLVAALGTHRPVEARASGGFAWGPYVGAKRTNAGPAASATRLGPRASILAAAERARLRAIHEPEDAMAMAALGIAYLVIDEPAQAVDALEEAHDRQPSDALILNDLSAAYLTRGQAQDTAADFARALDAAERSTRAEPSPLEAWFNRALALERQRLHEPARMAWRDYLQHDAASPWAGEARARLAALGTRPAPITRPALDSALSGELPRDVVERLTIDVSPLRDYVDNDLLSQWAAQTIAAQGSPAAAASALRGGARLASHVARIGGDVYLRDIVDGLRGAAGSTPRARLDLARGIEAFHSARASLDRSDADAAEAPLERARRSLSSVPSLALHVELYRLVAQVQRGLREEVLPALARLERQTASRGYRYLSARAHLLRGLIQFRLAAFTDAMTAFGRAAAGFREAKESPFLATALTYRAEVMSAIGDHERAWVSQIEAFDLLDVVTDHRRRHSVLVTGGLLPLEAGLAGAALHVQRAALENAQQWNVAGSHVAARLQLARSFAVLHRRAEAQVVLAEAKAWAARVPDATLRRQYLIEVALAEGDVAAAGDDAPGAITAYTQALGGLGAIKSWYRLSPIYLKRGRAHAARQDWASAERDWRAGLALVEEQRRSLHDDGLRMAHLDELWDLYAALIELEALQRGNAEEALNVVERGRARVLLESMDANSVARGVAVAPADARPRVPAGTTAVVYVALERRLLIWVVSEDAIHMTVVDIPRVTLQRLVGAFRNRVHEAGESHELARRLYTLTWAPIAARLQGRSSVVIVPDGPLALMPFAALEDEATYLVERHALSLAPSLATLRLASERMAAAPPHGGTPRRALIAADPAIDRLQYPELRVLHAAREEANGIAALYDRPLVLRGSDVTKSRLMAELARADLFHFAGHAVSNDLRPDQAHLVVAASGDGARATRLEAADIARLRLDGLRLVLLSACQTATGRAVRGEGTLSLARPFLVAGVPTVIATLWLVDDTDARDMMLDIHRHLRAGDAPDVALQRAQLARLREARSLNGPLTPSTGLKTLAWADFVVLGAAHMPHR